MLAAAARWRRQRGTTTNPYVPVRTGPLPLAGGDPPGWPPTGVAVLPRHASPHVPRCEYAKRWKMWHNVAQTVRKSSGLGW
eukprot:gene17183-biopygen11363